MATNEILPFAQGGGANVQSQIDYAAEPLRSSGNVAGIARSAVNNKALRQASVLASALAQYIADNQPNDVTDSLTPATIAFYLLTAIRSGVKTDPNFSALLSGNGYQKLPSGLIVQWGTSGAMSGSPYASVNVTFPIAFPNAAVTCIAMSTGAAISVSSSGPSLTQVGLVNSSATGAPAKWVAIGY